MGIISATLTNKRIDTVIENQIKATESLTNGISELNGDLKLLIEDQAGKPTDVS